MDRKDISENEIIFDTKSKENGDAILALSLVKNLYEKKEIPGYIYQGIKKDLEQMF